MKAKNSKWSIDQLVMWEVIVGSRRAPVDIYSRSDKNLGKMAREERNRIARRNRSRARTVVVRM